MSLSLSTPAVAPPTRALLAAMILAAGVEGARADTLVAAETIRAGTVLEPRHLALRAGPPPPGVLESVDAALGQEARVALFQGRPIRPSDLTPPRLVRRNDIVRLRFTRGALAIRSEGRALEDGALGARIRVMNLDSRLTIIGQVSGPQQVEIRR